MRSLVIRDLTIMLQSQSNIIQPVQQTMPHELIHRKLSGKPLLIPHFTLLQIDGDLVVEGIRAGPRPALDQVQVLTRALKIGFGTEVRHIDNERRAFPTPA